MKTAKVFLFIFFKTSSVDIDKVDRSMSTNTGLNPFIKTELISETQVNDGTISSTANARLIRDGAIIYTGKIGSIFREKNQVKQVDVGQECGITLKDYNDYQKKDIIEAFSSTTKDRMI